MLTKLVSVTLLLSPILFCQSPTDNLRKMLDDQTAAWNRGDLVSFMQGYEDSPELTFFSGDTIARGWQATLERYRRKYQGNGKEMGQLNFTDVQLDMLGAGAAVYTARWHLAFQNGQKLEGLTTVICKLTKNGWKIVHDHSS
jgi:ketosteroid isomerase-like protein